MVAVPVLPALSFTLTRTWYVPACVYVCETDSPVAVGALSPKFHEYVVASTPEVASDAVALNMTS